jgi:hypothetical protein
MGPIYRIQQVRKTAEHFNQILPVLRVKYIHVDYERKTPQSNYSIPKMMVKEIGKVLQIIIDEW